MKILIAIRDWGVGGAQSYALHLMSEFKQMGHEIFSVVGLPGGKWESRALKMGCVFYVNVLQNKSFSQISFGHQLLKNSYDIIIGNLLMGDLICYELKRLKRVKYIVSIKHMLCTRVIENESAEELWDSLAADNYLEPLFCCNTDLIIAVSDAVKKSLIERGIKQEINVLPLCLPQTKACVSYKNNKIPHKKKWVWGTLSRLHRDKGVDLLIHACAQLKYNPHWHLLIASDGPDKKTILKLIENYELSDRIKLIGAVDNALDFLKSIDVLILPSRREGYPIVIHEAASVGTPTFSTPVGGVVELAKFKKVEIFKDQNPTDIAEGLKELLTGVRDLSIVIKAWKNKEIIGMTPQALGKLILRQNCTPNS